MAEEVAGKGHSYGGIPAPQPVLHSAPKHNHWADEQPPQPRAP